MKNRPGLCVHCGAVTSMFRYTSCVSCRWLGSERLRAKIDTSGGPNACWPWIGAKDQDGYGLFKRNKKHFKAHRFVLAEALGRSLLPGMLTCHTCDNPPCCNPAHLYEGTNAQNRADARGKWVGERSPNARLTYAQVQEIRSLRAALTQREVAVMYGVSPSLVSHIQTGRSRVAA